MNSKIKRNAKSQQGIATLAISIILLIMTTMAVVLSANIGVMERKISANDNRASQARLSAQAGIDLALANFSKYGLANPVAPYVLTGNYIKTTGDQTISYSDNVNTSVTGYYNISVDTTLADYPNVITIVAQGLSDDKTASASITQKLQFASPMQGLVADNNFILNKAILIVAGAAEIDSSLINNIDGTASTLLKAWTKLAITDINPSPPSTVFGDSLELTDNGIPPLDYVFLSTMRAGSDRGLKHISNRTNCSAACTNPPYLINQPESKMHYLEGSININNLTIGTPTYPVILMVDLSTSGSLSITNSTINGLLLIKGNWDNNNNTATVNGAVVIENGDLLQGNNLSINYSQSVYDNLKNVGVYTRNPSSWNDIN